MPSLRITNRPACSRHAGLLEAALPLLVLGLGAGPGCLSRVSTPKATLRSYLGALQAGDYERAYQLMSRSFRKEFDRDEYINHHRRNPKEIQQTVAELKKGPSRLKVQADYAYGDGNRIHLEMEKGVWRIALDPVVFYSQRSPREALRSFVRAMERRRYAIVLKFVPNQWARVMTVKDIQRLFSKEQMEPTEQLLRNLKANLANKIEVKGDEAFMLYGDRFQVKFLREDGIWKIVDAD
jgi:hypothetical protein